MTLKELRKSKKMTQVQASEMTGIPLRTYKNYENDPSKANSVKYLYIRQMLENYGIIDEEHGILTIEDISSACHKVFSEYDIKYCFLFGSYAKNNANEKSDVDLLISGSVEGIKFYGIAERLREEMHKNVDLLDLKQLNNNAQLINEILKDGIKIYEQSKDR